MRVNPGSCLMRAVLLVALILPTLLCLLTFGTVVALGVLKDSMPDWFESTLSGILGIQATASSTYSLSQSDAEKVAALGYDPEVVANTIAAINWVKEDFDANIDIGMMLAIFQYESGGGRNMGSCDAKTVAAGLTNINPAVELAAIDWHLKHWQEFDIRAHNPIAAKYVYDDYSGYIGHCAAAEMGSQGILPSTGLKICRDGLSKSEDQDIASCDYWLPKTAPHASAWWLDAIRYSADLDDAQKINRLYGWNRNQAYRELLVRRSHKINEELGPIVGDLNVSQHTVYNDSAEGWLASLLVAFLQMFDLLPENIAVAASGEAQQWLSLPLKPQDNNGLSQDWGSKLLITPPAPFHLGVDYGCAVGKPILAVADGVVVNPSRYVYKNDPFGWGLALWVDHGGIFSFYGHLSALRVNYGDTVKKGDVIGECGATGFSRGSHIHFGVTDLHPDDFVKWYQMNPGWLNPHNFLGKWVDPREYAR